MRLVCILCGRDTEPAAMVGSYAIGPKCAAKAGLLPGKLPKGTRVVFPKVKRERVGDTLELFGDELKSA